MTKQEKVINLLIKKGYVEIACISKKYRQFVKSGNTDSLFVGKKGACRIGKTVSNSTSMSHIIEKLIR